MSLLILFQVSALKITKIEILDCSEQLLPGSILREALNKSQNQR